MPEPRALSLCPPTVVGPGTGGAQLQPGSGVHPQIVGLGWKPAIGAGSLPAPGAVLLSPPAKAGLGGAAVPGSAAAMAAAATAAAAAVVQQRRQSPPNS